MSSLRPSRTLQNLEVSGLRYARNEVPVNGGLMQVEDNGEVIITRNVELDTLTVVGETTFTGDVTVNTTIMATTVNATNLNVSGPSILDGLVTSVTGVTAASLYVTNGIMAGGSLNIAGPAMIGGLLTAAAGITTTNIDTDTMRARDIAVDTLHVVTIDDVNVVSSVSTNVVRSVQIVAGTEDPLYTFLPGHALDVLGNTYVAGNVGVGITGPTVALDVAGAANFGGIVTANAGITASSMNVSGPSTVYGTQTVYNLFTAFSGITSSMINVSGAATVYGDSTVKGLFTASGGITGSSLAISGNTVLYGTETVKGLLTAEGGITGSSLNISGNTTLYGLETVKGLLMAEGGITSSSLVVSNGITGFGSLHITGAATFNSTETVKGLLTAEGGITSSSLVVSNGITGFGTLHITGAATFNSTETVNGLLTANAGITSSSLYVTNGITGNSTLRIVGTASVGGLLTANGGVTSTTIDGNTITSYNELFIKSTGTQAVRMVTDASRSYIQPYTTPTNTGSELRITKFGSTVPVLSIDTLNSTVGISTAASSAYTLDVNGTSRFNNLITATGGITASSLHVSGTITYGSESFDVFLANSAGVGVNTITSGYNMEVNGKTRYRDVIAIANGTVSAPGLGFYSEPGTGLYRPNPSQFGFTTSGTEQLRIADKDLYIYPTTSAYIGTTSAYNSNAWTTIESGYQDVTNPTSAVYVSAQGLKICGQDLIWNSGATRSYGSKIWIGGGQSQFAAVNNSDIILETANAERLRIYGDGNAAFMNNLRVYGGFQVDGNVTMPSSSANNIKLTASGPSGRQLFISPQVNAGSFSLITQAGDAALVYSNGVTGGGFCVGPRDLGGLRLDAFGNANITGNLSVTGNISGAGVMPVGSIVMHAGSSLPAGWLYCDGTLWNQSAYPSLCTALGNTFGGDGTTNFRVPDMRDRFVVGAGSTYNRNTKGGNDSITLSESQLPSHTHSGTTDASGAHTHTATDNGHVHGYVVFADFGSGNPALDNADSGDQVWKSQTNTGYANITVDPVGSHSHTFTTGPAGSGASIDIRPKYIGMYYIIKF
jgi:microcystin-dependent protein